MSKLNTNVQIPAVLRDGIKALKPAFAMQAIGRGMEKGTADMVGAITKHRLTGEGPFPKINHRLGVKTGRLRRSFHWTGAASIQGKEVTTQLGVTVKYAAAHEFGFKGTVKVPAHQRKGKNKSFLVKAHTMKMNIPERSPIRTGMKDYEDLIVLGIKDELLKELER